MTFTAYGPNGESCHHKHASLALAGKCLFKNWSGKGKVEENRTKSDGLTNDQIASLPCVNDCDEDEHCLHVRWDKDDEGQSYTYQPIAKLWIASGKLAE